MYAALPACYQFNIYQPWSKPVWHGKNIVLKILDQHIGNCIRPVNEVEEFKACPDIVKIPEWGMASPAGSVTIQKQNTKANINPDVWLNG